MRFKISTALFASLFMLMPITTHSAEFAFLPDLKTAKLAHKVEDYTTAAKHWMPLAHKGIAAAQLELGRLYKQGIGVQKNNQTAFNLFLEAAKQNNAKSMFEIGQFYEKGILVSKDIKKAKTWYQRSADHGYARGSFAIAKLHEKNKLTPLLLITKDTKGSIRASLNAIKDGDYTQAESLGDLYLKGIKHPQDNQKALTYYIVARQNGSSRAAQQANNLKAQLSVEQYKEARKNAVLLLSKSEKGLKPVRKTLVRQLKTIEQPMLSTIEKEDIKTNALKYYKRASQMGYIKAEQNIAKINGEDVKIVTHTPVPHQTYRITSSLKTQLSGESNLDLNTNGNESETAISVHGNMAVYLYPTDDVTIYGSIHSLYSDGKATSDSDDEDYADLNLLEMRQAWIKIDNLCNLRPVSIKIGRQRMDEERKIWWNHDIDAVKLSFDTTLTRGFIAIGENQSKYRIGDDNDLERDEENRLRLMAELSHNYTKNHAIEARLLFENDHSGTPRIGSIIPSDDRDREDNNLLWTGLRATGYIPSPASSIYGFDYRTDIMSLIGKEKITTTTAGPSADLRTVNATTERDVFGWAFDGNFDIKFKTYFDPTLRLGYAYGSGDNSGRDNTAFRQTGLQGNRGTRSDKAISSSIRNYGEVLRPELSNIHIANIGLNATLLKHSDINLNYFNYWLDKDATSLRSSGITAPLNSQDSHLGQALDIAADIHLGKELGIPNHMLNNTILKLRLGGFKAGAAYGSAEGEYAYRASTELRVSF